MRNSCQLLRIGALLHDIGHFPVSHAVEDVLAEIETERDRASSAEFSRDVGAPVAAIGSVAPRAEKLHETTGRLIVESDAITSILDRHGVNRFEVAAVIAGESDTSSDQMRALVLLSQMLHSQIDADRIDYLLRDSDFTGVEGGGFDLDKLYREVYWRDNVYGFKSSGLRAVEQFLMARLTNYRTVIFNKHVQGYETILKTLYKALVDLGAMPNFASIKDWIAGGHWSEWVRFNDHMLMDCTCSYAHGAMRDPWLRSVADQIMRGQPPIEIRAEERICTRAEWDAHRRLVSTDTERDELADRARIDRRDLFIVNNRPFEIIREGAEFPINILQDSGAFKDIRDTRESFMESFRDKKLFLWRLYGRDQTVSDRVRPLL